MELQLPPDVESSLRSQAAKVGMDVEQFAVASLERLIAAEESANAMLPRSQWKTKFDAVRASFPMREGASTVDCSRDSIYGDRGR